MMAILSLISLENICKFINFNIQYCINLHIYEIVSAIHVSISLKRFYIFFYECVERLKNHMRDEVFLIPKFKIMNIALEINKE